jgi:glycosyltransferase involved in cell wall biosynthesis
MRIKILDLFSLRLPIVSTTIGCEGIKTINNKDIIIADTSEEFYNAISDLWDNPNKRIHLLRNSVDLIKREYSFETAINKFNQLIDDLLSSSYY